MAEKTSMWNRTDETELTNDVVNSMALEAMKQEQPVQRLATLDNLQYGGLNGRGRNDGQIEVVSNLSGPFLDRVLTELERQDRLNGILEPSKNLVVVNRDPNHLEYVLGQLFPEYLAKSSHETKVTQLAHHNLPSAQEVYNALNGSLIRAVYARCKGVDSITEKLARLCANRGGMGYTDETQKSLEEKESNERRILLPGHVALEDTYGITVVCSTEADCLAVERDLSNHPLLECIETEDYFAKPKNDVGGYSALHKTYVWMGNHIPTGTLLEVHFETEEGHLKNQLGGNDPRRSHVNYGNSKLDKPHTMEGYQVFVLTGIREPILLDSYHNLHSRILKN